MNKRTIISAIILLSLFTACDMSGSKSDWNPDRHATIRVKIAADQRARTVMPSLALEDVTTWQLWGGKQGSAETLLAEFSNTTAVNLTIEPAVWHFTLKGIKDGSLILTGSVEQSISEGENLLNFTVDPILEGQGTLNIVINLPAGSGITQARVFVDGTHYTTVTPANDQIVYSGYSYDVGVYHFSVRLYKDDVLYGAVSEVVYVWANLQSAKTYTLGQEDLNLTYIITYHSDGGTEYGYYKYTDANVQLITPSPHDGYAFTGWYDNAEFSGDAVSMIYTGSTGNKDFYAKWTGLVDTPSNLTLTQSLAWIANNAEEGGAYAITINNDETIAPQSLYYSGYNVNITLNGGNAERTVSLSTTGSLFTVGYRVTLTLGNNVTLQGLSDNTNSLVYVNSGALVLESGSKITGNTSSSYSGGGVYVDGTFTQSGGEISGNSASSGGGVYVSSSGMFTQSGGEITGNSAPGSPGSVSGDGGGGVYVWGGTFTQSGGAISGNTASNYGGGVYVNGGTFTQSGGEISGNSTASNGGGVYVYGTFMMNGGTISGNTASSYYYYGYGGGVYVGGGTFTKQTGGIIYGANAEVGLKNTATNGDSYGHAVYVDGSPGKLRHNTAGSDVTLDSAVSGSAGGWEVPDSSLADWLAWLSNNAEEGGDYTYTLGADESIAPQSLSYSGKNVSISVDGGDAERTVSLNTTGALFTVGSYVTLTLGNNVTLQGLSDNTNSLVYVNSGALVMESGSKITGNTNSSGNGGGVYVDGTFTMNGGTISGNTASSGGGVYVSSSGTFTQSGGIISGNTAYNSGSGVYVYGTFTQSGGAISGNTASVGGGVFVYYSGTFTKQVGGTIYGANAEDGLKNTATSGNSYGHAVYVNYGYIRHNTAGSDVTLDSATSGAAGGWEELSGVQISLQTTSGDPSVYYYNTSLAVNQSGYFYTDSGYASYTWYWDGEVIAGATAYDYNLAAHSKTSGIYELLVVVTTSAGEKLSARCQVNINAN